MRTNFKKEVYTLSLPPRSITQGKATRDIKNQITWGILQGSVTCYDLLFSVTDSIEARMQPSSSLTYTISLNL